MISFDILTLFPNLFSEYANVLPFKRAIEKNLITLNLWDLKKYSVNNYGSVDDKPYGGGKGMIISIEPIFNALSEIYKTEDVNLWHSNKSKKKIVLLSPRGERFTQRVAESFLTADQITFICGRYEGIDARVEEHLATDVISIGDFVLSGGEVATTAIMESITRLIPGVLEDEVTKNESFQQTSTSKEHKQYTRPENFRGMEVPKVLLSGNHKEIDNWKQN